MTDEKIYGLFEKYMDKLSDMIAELKTITSNHETRLAVLETEKKNGFKDQLIMWLVKGLLIALGVIATSAGAASVLKPILGM